MSSGRFIWKVYLSRYDPSNAVGLYRQGTRVIENLATLPEFNKAQWDSSYLQGILDVPYLSLTPGTRSGIIQDEAYQRLIQELTPIEAELTRIIDEQRRAEEEQTSRDVLRSVQKALKEALLALPAEEYDWFDLHEGGPKWPSSSKQASVPGDETPEIIGGELAPGETAPSPQKEFFEYSGPLFLNFQLSGWFAFHTRSSWIG